MSLAPDYNKITSSGIQKLDMEMYDKLLKNADISRAIMGEAASLRKAVDTMSFSVAKLDNGFLILFSGSSGEKRFVAKTGNEVLEIIAGRLTETRLAENSLSGGGNDAAESA